MLSGSTFHSHSSHLSHLFTGEVVFCGIEEEPSDVSLVILLATDVTHEVYSSQSASDYANSELAELERDDRYEGEYTPHYRDYIRADPEYERVRLVRLASLAKGLKVPGLLSLLINLTPPSKSYQNPNSKKVRVRKLIIIDNLKNTYLPVTFLTIQKSTALSIMTIKKQKVLSSIKMPRIR